MLVDDVIMLFRSAQNELENPLSNDVLYLNACLWIYDKTEGIIIYITGDKKETTFSLFFIKCSECQYYERCFVKKKNSKQVDIGEMLGIGKLGHKD